MPKRKKKPETAEAAKIEEAAPSAQPTTAALEELAKMPEDTQIMALGFAHGVEATKRQ